MNKLHHSMYLCTPSGTKSKDVALLLLSLSILHYFSKAPKEGVAKQFRFATPSVLLFIHRNRKNRAASQLFRICFKKYSVQYFKCLSEPSSKVYSGVFSGYFVSDS